MNFDGIDYRGATLIPPMPGHPNAPAIGDLFASALRIGYLRARRGAQILGVQTYRQRRRTWVEQDAATVYSAAVDVAEVRFWRPPHVRGVTADVWYTLINTGSTVVRHQIQASDGVDSANGSVTQDEVTSTSNNATVTVAGRSGPLALSGWGQLLLASCAVDVSGLVAEDEVTARVTGWAAGQGYRPELVVVWGYT